MIAKLKWRQSNAHQNIEQLQNPTMGVTINNETTPAEPPPLPQDPRNGEGVRTRNLHDSVQAIHPPCYEFSCDLVSAYNILDLTKCMFYSKHSELNITLLLVNIIVNTECQHSQHNAAGL